MRKYVLPGLFAAAWLAVGGCTGNPVLMADEKAPEAAARAVRSEALTSGCVYRNTAEVNAAMLRVDPQLTFDLTKLPAVLDAEEIRKIIGSVPGMPGKEVPELFAGTVPLDENMYRAAIENTEPVLKPRVRVQKAVSARRTSLKTLPQDQGWYAEPGDVLYDELQIAVLEPGEPVVVLTPSRDGLYTLVRTAIGPGWVRAGDLVTLPELKWRQFVAPSEFVVLTEPAASAAGEGMLWHMGARLPLTAKGSGWYEVLVPDAAAAANRVKTLRVPADAWHEGYLPWARGTMVAQALKYVGWPYGWGGMEGGVDCSGFLHNVLRTFGVVLPPYSGKILAALPNPAEFTADSSAGSRLAALAQLPPGALMGWRGHVMMGLGMDNHGRYTALQSLSSYYPKGRDGGKFYLRQVVLSGLEAETARGPMLQRLSRAGDLFGCRLVESAAE